MTDDIEPVLAHLGKSWWAPASSLGLRPNVPRSPWEATVDHHQIAASLLARPEFDVIAWIDPVCDRNIPTDSDEALVVLCPVLGPSATIVLHRLARYATTGPTTWDPVVFAATFGLSKNSANGLATKAIARLARFGFATIGSSTLAVRTHVPSLPQRWLDSLPDYLRADPAVHALG